MKQTRKRTLSKISNNPKLCRLSAGEKECLTNLFLKEIGMRYNQNKDGIYMGYTYPKSIIMGIKKAMRWWVKRHDLWLDKTSKIDSNGMYSIQYEEVFARRGITFEEFEMVINSSTDENEFKHHRAFSFLMLSSNIQKKKWLYQDLTEEEEIIKYLKVLEEYEVPIANFLSHTKLNLYIPRKALQHHGYIVSQSGSGKTEKLKVLVWGILRQSITSLKKTSVIVISPHGDICWDLLGFIFNKKIKNKIVYLNPTIHKLIGTQQRYTPVLNPFYLENKSPENIDATAQWIARSIKEMLRKPGQDLDSTVSDNMIVLLKHCITVLLRKGDSDLLELQRFLIDKNNQDLIELGKQDPDPVVSDFFNWKFNISTFKQSKNGVITRIEKLFTSPLFRGMLLGKSTVHLEKSINDGSLIIVDYQKGRGMDSAIDFGKLILGYIEGIAFRRQDIPVNKRPEVYVIIDEAHNYVGDNVKTMFDEARKFGISLILANQRAGQDMANSVEDSVMANAGLKIVGKNSTRSLQKMGENIDIPLEELKQIPKYEFYVHDKHSDASAFLMHVPDKLVKHRSNMKNMKQFYMTKKEKIELLKYFVFKSGYYKPAKDFEKITYQKDTPQKLQPTNTPGTIIPKESF